MHSKAISAGRKPLNPVRHKRALHAYDFDASNELNAGCLEGEDGRGPGSASTSPTSSFTSLALTHSQEILGRARRLVVPYSASGALVPYAFSSDCSLAVDVDNDSGADPILPMDVDAGSEADPSLAMDVDRDCERRGNKGPSSARGLLSDSLMKFPLICHQVSPGRDKRSHKVINGDEAIKDHGSTTAPVVPSNAEPKRKRRRRTQKSTPSNPQNPAPRSQATSVFKPTSLQSDAQLVRSVDINAT